MSKTNKTFNKQRSYTARYSEMLQAVPLNNLTAQLEIVFQQVEEDINDIYREFYQTDSEPSDGLLTTSYCRVLVNTDNVDTLYLPDATLAKQKRFYIKWASGTPALNLYPAAASGQLIDEDTDKTWSVKYATMEIYSDGSNWWII